MKKVLKQNIEAGSRESHEPRLLGSIVEKMLHGNSPLAKGYRQYCASPENMEADGQGWHPNTDLDCDLKTFLRSDRRMLTGKDYFGVLRRDSDGETDEFLHRDPHYTFIESAFMPSVGRRNVHLYIGKYITCTERLDGTLRLNFRNLNPNANFSVDGYAIEVANEIREALVGLIVK